GTPPGTPPTTPPAAMLGGGASSSLIICTFSGIFVGVRSCPFCNSLWTLTTLIGAAAGGGGGGGGGGGATRNVISCCFGRASVNKSGISTRIPMRTTWMRNDTVVVTPRFDLSLPPDSMRLSSNIGNLLHGTLRILRHRLVGLCSQSLTARAANQHVQTPPGLKSAPNG